MSESHEPVPEVRTQRLVVVDPEGRERIVGEVVNGYAELRLAVPFQAEGRRASVVLYSTPRDDDAAPAVGVQVWGDGDALLEFNAWQDSAGAWRANAHVADEHGRTDSA